MRKIKMFKSVITSLLVAMIMTITTSVAFAAEIPYKVSSFSSEDVADGYLAKSLEDDALVPLWHTDYTTPAPLPHWIVLDLGATKTINELKYLPRQDNNNTNGHITKYEIQVSLDNKTFTKVTSGEWAADDNSETSAQFDATEARYVKLVAIAGKADSAAASAIKIMEAPASTETPASTDDSASTEAPATNNPETGDSGIQLYVLISLLAVAAFVVSKKIRFNHK